MVARTVASRFAFLDFPGPIAFAHRGGAGEAPENTREAFARAIHLGYRYLETDVHVTSDGVVVALHDPVLERVSDRQGRVAALPWAEVERAHLSNGEAPPRLEELLETWPSARWNIDAKGDDVVAPLARLLREMKAVDRVCVASFVDRRVARLRLLLGGEVCSGMGQRAIASLRLASLVRTPVRLEGAAVLQIPVRQGPIPLAERLMIDRAHKEGLAVHVWTVDDPPVMERLLDIGVDGLMTDYPSRLRSVLVSRGQWTDHQPPA
ncbi:MAG: glycerophosphodiester phosphodiesterase [Acidimicrobiales bacterium]